MPRSRSCAASTSSRCANARWSARRAAGLQDRRHLRGRVPGAHAVPLLELRPRDRGDARATAARSSSSAPGPNRIGQGIEFDYSCVHASFALPTPGFETIMINCNPETVSTDYDTSDRLYFEPLTLEDVLEIIHAESQSGELVGVVVQLGGQTALGPGPGAQGCRACRFSARSPEAIDLAEERGLFAEDPRRGRAAGAAERHRAPTVARRRRGRREHRLPGAGAPVSFVLGGRGMEIVYDTEAMRDYFERVGGPRHHRPRLAAAGRPLPRRRDRDRRRRAVRRRTSCTSAAIMEHIEEAGIHSGDSACTLPPVTLGRDVIDRVRDATLGDRRGRRRARPAQRAVRDRPGRALRARGEPARVAHRAVRLEGARHPAGEGRAR